VAKLANESSPLFIVSYYFKNGIFK